MQTDLWMDLGNPANRRGHPLLLALLYVFCPAAAHWWLAGADPLIPFDPLWQAHNLRAGGRTLREALEAWGLGELLPTARKYVDRVEAFRAQSQHLRVTAPELLPTFLGGKLPVADRHGLAGAFERIGGWENFFPFVRAWAFTVRDWQQMLGLPGTPKLERISISTGEALAEPALLSVWKLRAGRRSVLGLFEPADATIGEWAAEVYLHGPAAAQEEELFILSETGTGIRAVAKFGAGNIRMLVGRMTELARGYPGLPVNALKNPSVCRRCGYRHLCWGDGEEGLTPLALELR